MGPTPFYGARAEKPPFCQKANECRLSGDIIVVVVNCLSNNYVQRITSLLAAPKVPVYKFSLTKIFQLVAHHRTFTLYHYGYLMNVLQLSAYVSNYGFTC